MSTKILLFLFLFLCCFGGGLFTSSENARAESFDLSSIPQTLSLSWDSGATTLSQKMLGLWFHPTSTLRFHAKHQTEVFSPTLCPWKLLFCNFSLTEQTRYSIGSETSFAFDETVAQQFLNKIREENRDNPIDAIFTVGENSTVSAFAPSRNGSELDTTAGLKIIKEALRTSHEKDVSVKIPSIALLPKIASTDANNLGITQFLGEGRTNFAGSPKNRVFNIKRAIEQFQGAIIAPGEDFSFVKRLGEVDGEHGYLPELVIKRGKTEPEFGGGICQVSTTLFRAALNTGQKITERHNHAYPVSYYKPYGMDATIYIPKPDFRFVNNTSGQILIQVAIEGNELVFRVYGTPDGRSVSINGPSILERSPDGAMKTVFTQTVLAADGSTMIEDTFKSSYDSPSKYPHPGTAETFTEKPKDWSEKQWSAYTKTSELPR